MVKLFRVELGLIVLYGMGDRLQEGLPPRYVKLKFHGTDTDTDTDFLADFRRAVKTSRLLIRSHGFA